MKITLNKNEVAQAISAHAETFISVEGEITVEVLEDGTAILTVGEEPEVAQDTPPVEPVKRTRRPRNPDAKHRTAEEVADPASLASSVQTAIGGTKTTDTTSVEPEPEEPEVVVPDVDTTEVEQPEPEAEEKAVEAPAETTTTSRPSLFAGLSKK